MLKVDKKALGQFFTPPLIADRLIQFLENDVKSVLDLGCGDGQLGESILKQFPDAHYIGIEKDKRHYQTSSTTLVGQTIIHADVLATKTLSKISTLTPVDTVIGNPPFLDVPVRRGIEKEIQKAIPSFLLFGKKIRSEILFFAKSLQQLQAKGQASFILPKTFFVADQYQYLRNHIVKSFSNISLFELPAYIFAGAEVSTCILSFVNKTSQNKVLTLGLINDQGKIVDNIQVDSNLVSNRMDYTYHKLIKQACIKNKQLDTISSIGGKIYRGNVSRNSLLQQQVPHFHTTSFPIAEDEVTLDSDVKNGLPFAREGDILLARVGSRCLDKQVIVKSGKRAITDCIYRLQVPEEALYRAMASLTSTHGKLWRQMNAKGACAKYLTKESILNMPLFD